MKNIKKFENFEINESSRDLLKNASKGLREMGKSERSNKLEQWALITFSFNIFFLKDKADFLSVNKPNSESRSLHPFSNSIPVTTNCTSAFHSILINIVNGII